jgi:hypothetical protein
MQRNSIKGLVTAVWVVVVCAAGIAIKLQTVSGWALLAAMAVLPPLVMMWRWNDPPLTMSETIQAALR